MDVVVTGIALLFTADWIIMQRPEPFYALMTGTGFGARIIAVALCWVKRGEALVELTDEAEVRRPTPHPDDAAAIKAHLKGASRRAGLDQVAASLHRSNQRFRIGSIGQATCR